MRDFKPLSTDAVVAGLRELADLFEQHGLPDRRHPEQALNINVSMGELDAVHRFARQYGLTVQQADPTDHATATLVLGRGTRPEYEIPGIRGAVTVRAFYIPPEPEATPELEPEATGVDTYDCPEPGCDYSVSAVGPLDADGPDYFTEEIEAHERGHAERGAEVHCPECAGLNGAHGSVHIRHEAGGGGWNKPCSRGGDPTGALTAPPGVELAPPPGTTSADRVRLDLDDVGHRVIAAALAFDELDDRREGLDVAGVDAWDTARETLRQALADFREEAAR